MSYRYLSGNWESIYTTSSTDHKYVFRTSLAHNLYLKLHTNIKRNVFLTVNMYNLNIFIIL